jgi:hypothetical protein
MTSLAEALPEQQARVREVLTHYKEIGDAGKFGAYMIEHSLSKADKAVMSGDINAMIAAHEELKDIE